jgi:hypothetical protein
MPHPAGMKGNACIAVRRRITAAQVFDVLFMIIRLTV